MRCKTCDYPLWQISARACPECGSPFKPSDYEFIPNSVRFCCPHCEQDYYGTGPTGHLVPRAFTCVRCNRPIEMDEMVLLPTEGVQEVQTELARQPWLERGVRRSTISAFFATVGHALIKPGQLLKATPPESGTWAATAFMLAVQLTISFCYGMMFLVLFGVVLGAASSIAGGGRGGGTPPVGLFALGMGAGWAVGLFVIWIVLLLLQTLVVHGILRASGGCAHGIGRTWQALCYSAGANVMSAVPCLGGYFGWIWWLVSACIAVKEAQRVRGGRAALAVLTLPILLLVTVVGVYATFLVYAVRAMPSGGSFASGPMGTIGMNAAGRAGNITRAARSAKQPFTHIAELASSNSSSLTAWDFMDTGDNSNGGFWARAQQTPVGDTTLDAFNMGSPAEQRQAATAAAAALSPNTIAYRLGDTVLTHPGIDIHSIPPGSAARDLWIVIAWPESLVSGTFQTIAVGEASGSVRSFTASMMPTELAKQNTLRAQFGLPAIPDPATITHAAPALGNEPPMLDLGKESAKPSAPGAP